MRTATRLSLWVIGVVFFASQAGSQGLPFASYVCTSDKDASSTLLVTFRGEDDGLGVRLTHGTRQFSKLSDVDLGKIFFSSIQPPPSPSQTGPDDRVAAYMQSKKVSSGDLTVSYDDLLVMHKGEKYPKTITPGIELNGASYRMTCQIASAVHAERGQ